jgi:hypothetical protein
MKLGNQLILVITLTLAGCAGVKFTDDGSTEDQGFLYYEAKPYLVVDRSKEGVALRVMSLPDLSKPRRVWQKRGWGSASFGFKSQNGILTEFNAASDNQADELLGSLASLGTASAAMDTARAALIEAHEAVDTTSVGALTAGPSAYPVLPVKTANAQLKDLADDIKAPAGANLQGWLARERASLLEHHKALAAQESVTLDLSVPDYTRALLAQLEKVKSAVKPIIGALRASRSTLESMSKHATTHADDAALALRAAAQLGPVISELATFADPSAGPEIYEILSVGTTIQLRRVHLSE